MSAPLQVRDALEPDDDLGRRGGERLPGSDENQDSRPAPVLDLEAKSNERLGI
jgi:hypothetical protein